MFKAVFVLAALLAPAVAHAEDPAPEADPQRFTAGIFESYTHEQSVMASVFNDQSSTRVPQSSEAKRLVFGWLFSEKLGLLTGFDFPTRDETVREADVETKRIHYPKTLWAGLEGRILRYPLSKRGILEVAGTAGLRQGLAPDVLANLNPFGEVDVRIALTSGSLLQIGWEYAGIVRRGSWAMVFGAAQRF